MIFEGTFAGVALVVSFICFSVVMVCLRCSRRRRNNRLFVAGTHLIRAGEAFTDASEVYTPTRTADGVKFACQYVQ